jgi:hypothetical protein
MMTETMPGVVMTTTVALAMTMTTAQAAVPRTTQHRRTASPERPAHSDASPALPPRHANCRARSKARSSRLR